MTDAWENKEFKGTLCILRGFSAEGIITGRSYSAFDRRLHHKKCDSNLGFFSDSFYLDVTIRHFSGGVFWISDLLARIYWSSEINGPTAATSQRSK